MLGAAAATGAAAAVMAWLRAVYQVRTLPERILEWLLLFVPLGLFEAGLRQFGFEAKRYGLYGAIALGCLCLMGLATWALRQRWGASRIVALAFALWLFVMVGVMPLTGAGAFAVDLFIGREVAVFGHLVAALVYAAVLIWARGALDHGEGLFAGADSGARASRRAAISTTAGAVVASIAAVLSAQSVVRGGTTISLVTDPQEPVRSGGINQPNPHPQMAPSTPQTVPGRVAETRQAGGASTAEPAAVATAAPTTAPPAAPIAAPTAAPTARPAVVTAGSASRSPTALARREIKRDKDGALLTSGRRRGELAEFITPNADFYVVSKNPVADPSLSDQSWRLVVDGDVGRSINVDLASLRNLPAVEVTRTLECISNFVAKCELAPFGCDLISTAKWKAVRVVDVIALAGGLKPGVVSIATISADEFTSALPVEVAMRPDTLLAYEMNGQPLPAEHGFPARVLVPGRYGMKSAKWVVALRAMRREFVDWYGQRDWSRDAIVKTMTRIDSPAPGAVLAAGRYPVAGIAYAGDRGIAKVEYSADGGRSWQVAELMDSPTRPGDFAWTRWQGRFEIARSSVLTLTTRATDGTGALQPEAFSLPQPDGGAGWHSIEVRAL